MTSYPSLTMPTRGLIGQRPARYVRSEHTDIRRTIRKFRLLARLQAATKPTGSKA